MRARIAVPPTLLALAALALAAAPAQAHVHECIAGTSVTEQPETGSCPATADYEITVGWRVEPPLAGVMNGLDLAVQYGNGTFIPDLGTINAAYEYGGQTFPLSVSPQDDRPGWYTDAIIPTVAGQYAVHVNGTVNGHSLDVTANPESVDPATDIEFPQKLPDVASLQSQVASLQQQVQALSAKVNATSPGGTSTGAVTPVAPAPTPQASTRSTPGPEPVVALGLVAVAGLAWRRP